MISNIISLIITVICILIGVAYFTLAERKIMAAIQRRRGPNIVGFWGLLQPLADGLKAITKEIIIPRYANKPLFLAAPFIIFTLSLFNWIFIPFSFSNSNLNTLLDSSTINLINSQHYLSFSKLSMPSNSKFPFLETLETVEIWAFFSDLAVQQYYNVIKLYAALHNSSINLLFIFAISSLNIYGIIFAGWASNSKYAFLGALRSTAQMISYEVSLGLLIIPIVLLTQSLNLTEIVQKQIDLWFVIPLFPLAILFFISSLAETNRTPFDLPEAEAELVAGYNVEYSSITFAMFFLGEYSNMLLMSALNVLLFFGGWLGPFNFFSGTIIFSIKIIIFAFLFILVRAILPRYRYDQLMNLGWKIILPFSLAFILLASCLLSFEIL